jgi:hypothetical protein
MTSLYAIARGIRSGHHVAFSTAGCFTWAVIPRGLCSKRAFAAFLMDFVAMSADTVLPPTFTVTVVRGGALSGGTPMCTNGADSITTVTSVCGRCECADVVGTVDSENSFSQSFRPVPKAARW